MNQYDENLSENPFFQGLRNQHKELIKRATEENWVVCVPRVDTVSDILCEDDYLGHILTLDEEIGKYHTLNGHTYEVVNKVITLTDDTNVAFSTHIVFEETFYNEDFTKFKVWCLERPLESNDFSETGLESISSLRDCIDLLWAECLGSAVLQKLDSTIGTFISSGSLRGENLKNIQDSVSELYLRCLNLVLKQSKREKSKYRLANIKIAIETYIQHVIQKDLFNVISVCCSYDDASFNKIICNIFEIKLNDLDIKCEVYDNIPYARTILSRINIYGTVLGKINCVKHAISAISKNSTALLSADDIFPVLVFLIIKSGVPNWISNLMFMKHFNCAFKKGEEIDFLITTLEAALEHVRSLFNSNTESCGESIIGFSIKTENITLMQLFKQIRLGNCENVVDMLKRVPVNSPVLCHPLCSCDKCELVISQTVSNITSTVFSSDDNGFTALHVACMYGHPQIIDQLLLMGANVHACDISGATPLHYASSRGHQNALLLLLHSGADIHAEDTKRNTPLHAACNNGHDSCVKALLYFMEQQSNLNVNPVNNYGDTPLHSAARWGYSSIVKVLLDFGASTDIYNKHKLSPIDCANNVLILKVLTAAKSVKIKPMFNTVQSVPRITPIKKSRKDVKLQPKIHKLDVLFRAIANGDYQLTCYYLGLSSPEVNDEVQTDKLCHPLCSCEKCKVDVFTQQPCSSIDINSTDFKENTALHVAVTHNRTDIIKLLLENGANVNVKNYKGVTPLHLACLEQQISVVRELMHYGECNVNIEDSRGNTALHYACHVGDQKIVELLLTYGANVKLKNIAGKTGLKIAEERNYFEIASVLKK